MTWPEKPAGKHTVRPKCNAPWQAHSLGKQPKVAPRAAADKLSRAEGKQGRRPSAGCPQRLQARILCAGNATHAFYRQPLRRHGRKGKLTMAYQCDTPKLQS